MACVQPQLRPAARISNLLVVSYPADYAVVSDIGKKSPQEVVTFV
jgi:hypothetical protein